jgi:hypothetical protein
VKVYDLNLLDGFVPPHQCRDQEVRDCATSLEIDAIAGLDEGRC